MNSVDAGILAQAFEIVEAPPRDPLPDGTSVGPYRIRSLIASGGMGDVYRAHDERLGRDVALKVLPTGLTDDRERLERFAQEAKSASALNHPHIVAIYEIGRARPSFTVEPMAAAGQRQRPEEVHFIAMELIDGETLRDFLGDRPSLARRLEILAQAADGLGKAHAVGIVHRDLKPDNVMVSVEGYAKIVDFGLAKLVEPGNGWNPIGADSPTMRAITAQGELIGTAGYMSPEQILGKVIDQRSDIFSFGCIIYEAVTGRRPFNGESFVDTLHDVLHGTPAPLEHPELERIVGKCLVKDREYRYQSIRDIALDLRAAGEERKPEAPPRNRFPKIAASIFLGLVVVAVAGLIAWQAYVRTRATSGDASIVHSALQRITTTGHVSHLAISPDGRFAAYSMTDGIAGEGVWLQQIATGSRVNVIPLVPKTYYAGLTFSADGDDLLATRYEGSIYGAVVEVPILGGTPAKLIGDADTLASPSPDGRQLAVTRDVLEKGEGRLLVTARDGSRERVLATLSLTMWPASPAWSPDGKTIAVTHGQSVFTIDVASGVKKSVPLAGPHGAIRDVAWTAAGDALIISAVDERSTGHNQLLHVDVASGAMTSLTDDSDEYREPHPIGSSIAAIQTKFQSALWSVTPGIPATQLTGGLGTTDGLYGLTSTRDRHVIYTSSAGGTVDLWTANADGSDPRQLTNDDRLESHPVVTADGSTIVYISQARGASAVWRMNIDGSQARAIAAAPAIYDFAVSPDGKRIVYASSNDTSNRASLMSVSIDGGSPATIATTGPFLMWLQFTPDGRTVIYSALDDKAIKMFKVAAGGGPVTKLFDGPGHDAAVSPDGKLIVFASGMEETGAKMTILSLDGSTPPHLPDLTARIFRWTPDGKGIVYIKHDGRQENLFVQPLAGGSPTPLTTFTDGAIASYEWSPDGQRIVLTHFLQMRDVVVLNAGKR
ncbi:MAG TPA: protein kinase [Thermoanaerobaculia bacterium]|nr:protein kinase [Thermoanaerobaculia bacterium]